MSETFEPLIIGFTCNWCSYRAADLAGISRKKYPPNIRLIRLMCSGRLDPSFVLKAFAGGADGILVSGCHPGECHYLEQNYKMLRRFTLLKRMLVQMGIEPERLRLVWASAAEGIRFAEEVSKMVEEVRGLGPLNWPGNGHARGMQEKLASTTSSAEAGNGKKVAAAKATAPAVKAAKPTPPGSKKPAGPPTAGVKPAGPPQPTIEATPQAAKPASVPGTKKAMPPPGKSKSVKPAPPPGVKNTLKEGTEPANPEEAKS